MARISLGVCLLFVVASSVIYEAQGTFLLKTYLKNNFPRKCNEFPPYANKGMLTLATNLESNCPTTPEFKNFFTQFKSYMSFINTASKNVDAEMKTKSDGLFKAMSAMSSGKGEKSADAGALKATMLSMGKTLVEQKKNTNIMSLKQKKELVTAMVKWTKSLATFVKSASDKKGKTINIASYGLDVNVNDISIDGGAKSGGSPKSSSSSKPKESKSGSSGAAFKDTTGKTSGSPSGSPKAQPSGSRSTGRTLKSSTESSSKKKESSGGSSGLAYKDSTGKSSESPSGSPKAESSGSSSAGSKTSMKGSASEGSSSSSKKETKTSSERKSKSSSQSSSKKSSTTSVKQVESETSKEAMSFIMELEKKYSANADLKVFFEKLKASMQVSSRIASKTSKDYVSATAAANSKLAEAMALVGSRNVKSAKMKSNLETSKDEMTKCLKQLQDINSKILSAKTVTSTQQSEIKQTITKWEKVTTQFVESAASSKSSSSTSSSSSSSSSSASQQQGSGRMIKTN